MARSMYVHKEGRQDIPSRVKKRSVCCCLSLKNKVIKEKGRGGGETGDTSRRREQNLNRKWSKTTSNQHSDKKHCLRGPVAKGNWFKGGGSGG